MDKVWTRLLITTVALVILGVLVVRGTAVDAGTVALAVLAVVPWLAAVVESIDLPGGGSLRLREVQATVQRQEEKLNAQQAVITQLVVYSMSWYVFDLLSKLYHRSRSGEEYLFHFLVEVREQMQANRSGETARHLT